MSVAKVAVIMGSDSDWPVMKDAADVLKDAGVEVVSDIVSAHRTPDKMAEFAKSARDKKSPHSNLVDSNLFMNL